MTMTLRDQRGFTVAEVLVAAVIVSLAFVALGTIVPIATYAVQEGYQLSTATFLADQKLEQIKNLPWACTGGTGTDSGCSPPTGSTTANDCLGISASSTAAPKTPGNATCTFGATFVNPGGALTWVADESETSITNFNGYSRQVRVTDCGAGAGCMGIVDPGMRFVTVTVSYTSLSATGNTASGTKSYSVSMIVSKR